MFWGALKIENLVPFCSGRLGEEGIVPHSVGGSLDSPCFCSYAYGRGTDIGPHTGEWCWPLLAGVWRAIAPLMKPWCAEWEVPTAANLNLYRGRNSCVGWHSDDEPLFGECEEVKLIVSVSFSTRALFKWNGKFCPDSEASSCWLGHGDLLVIDGQCSDEFLHCTDPGLEQERINVTLRWIQQHATSCPLSRTLVACCLPTCAQGASVPVTEFLCTGVFLGFGFSLVLCAYGSASFASLHPCVYKAWVTEVCLLLDTLFGRRSVGALSL